MPTTKWQMPLAIGVIVFLLWLLSPILSPFIAALLLAWLGNPIVQRLQRAGRGRGFSVLIVFSLFFLLLAVTLLILVPIMWEQLTALIAGIPRLATWLKTTILPWVASKLHKDVATLLDPTVVLNAAKEHGQEIGNVVTLVLGYVSKSSGAFFVFISNVMLLPILSFYFLRDWPQFIQRIRESLPRAYEPKIVQLCIESNEVLVGFIRGQLLVMISLGAIYATGLWLVGLNSGLLIGFIAGMVSFVPYLGATVGILAAVVACLIQYGDINHLLLVALVFSVGQMCESFILTPWLVGDRIGLHPVTVIFAIMAGGFLFGFIGILLALPVSAVCNVLFKHAHAEYLKSKLYGAPIPAPDVIPERPEL